MSCDHALWFPHRRLSDEEAGALYHRLCEGHVSEVTPSSSVDAFYSELTAKHPEIDDVPEARIDDKEFCPWSIAFDRSPGHLIICCVWSRADYVGGLLRELAKKYGLALYDPQAERIFYPASRHLKKPWWKFR